MVINGREVDYYCGTSYYTLHGDLRVIDAACEAIRQYGLGPATLMNAPPYREVIERASAFFETETATYVISGYLADLVLLQALSDHYDLALVDERSHYSVFDGLHATRKRLVQFRHLDANDLAY